MEFLCLLLCIVAIVLLIAVLVSVRRKIEDHHEDNINLLLSEIQKTDQQNASQTQQTVLSSAGTISRNLTEGVRSMGEGISSNVRTMGDSVSSNIAAMKSALSEIQTAAAASQSEKLENIDRHVISRQETMNQNVEAQMESMQKRLSQLEQMSEQKLDAIRQSIQTSMQEMRQENTKKLDEIRGTVDEKLQDTLQKRIADSFQTVSNQLEQVYKGLGEMQNLASDVGSLKQILSGVKTRGILGEIQLGAILEEILSPEQYDTNIPTIPNSKERVEFAIRLPGDGDNPVYLPIDSKFPGDAYMHVQEAQQEGDAIAFRETRKQLEIVLKKSAKDIHDKYLEPPYTTTFGIMFLPFEGLYAEVVNMGLIEVLQRDYSINVAGPSTMAALLNSLQMGFHTLAIQKRSNEVWQVLGAVKTEFDKFEEEMKNMQKHLQQTSNDLEKLMGTRTRAIARKLKDVQEIDETAAEKLLLNESKNE